MEQLFTINERDNGTKARTGTLLLGHGEIKTPMFMPVGTNGTVKALDFPTIRDIGFGLLLSNTYHLYLRPGMETLSKWGGLHNFCKWDGNILTDSGGFQIFSLAPFRKITKEGVKFRSHIDGSYHFLTPEKVIDIQKVIGSDILMCLDVCTPPEMEYKKALNALYITSEWAKRSMEIWKNLQMEKKGRLFGIIQGNFYKELRKRSAEEIQSLDFPGIAIGGLSVGEPYEIFVEYLSYTAELLVDCKPHYVMGIGTPEYILAAVENGIDLFDCVLPTRIARNGAVFTRNGIIPIKKQRYADDEQSIDNTCGCRVCRTYSKGYLRHLFKTNEILGPMLASEHNLYFLKTFMDEIQSSIKQKNFAKYKKEFLEQYVGKQ